MRSCSEPATKMQSQIFKMKRGIKDMDNIFKHTSANWVRYDKYEWKESTDGVLYLTPAKDAVMSLYNPIKEYKELVLTALGIGLDVMQKKLLWKN